MIYYYKEKHDTLVWDYGNFVTCWKIIFFPEIMDF